MRLKGDANPQEEPGHLWRSFQVPRNAACATCGGKGAKRLSACATCLSVVYCGKGCQHAHWIQGHHRECLPLARRGFHNFVHNVAAAQQRRRPRPAVVEDEAGGSASSSSSSLLLVDAWLEEAGRAAAAAAALPLGAGATAAAAAAAADLIPFPGTDGLRTLCLLAKACLAGEPAASSATAAGGGATPPRVSEGSSSSGDELDGAAAAMYLKTLTVRGQLTLRAGVPRQKRVLALQNFQHAAAAGPTSSALRGESPLAPAWRARLAAVHARLLRAVGGGDKTMEAAALRVLREAVAVVAAGQAGEWKSEEARVAEAYLLLECSQLLYFDRAVAASVKEATEAAALCRRALGLLRRVEEEEEGGVRDALVATAAFRLADLTLTLHGDGDDGDAANEEALALCRESLRHAHPGHFATLAAYMAHALAALRRPNGLIEARAEVEAEQAQRVRRVASEVTTESLLSLRGLDAWALATVTAATTATAAAVASSSNHTVLIKGAQAPCTEPAPTITITTTTNATNATNANADAMDQDDNAIPSTEEPEGDSMDVVEEANSSNNTNDDCSAAFSSSSYACPSPVVVCAAGGAGMRYGHHRHHEQYAALSSSSSCSRPLSPPCKRKRSYYPFFQQVKVRVTLPWVAAK